MVGDDHLGLHTIVIGGGIAGCACALALREAGAPVMLFERCSGAAAATGAAAGMLAPQYEVHDPKSLLPLLLAARDAYAADARRLEAVSSIALDFRQDGLLVANFGEAQHEEAAEMAERHRLQGLEAELLDPDDARRILAQLGEITSALWLPREAAIDAHALARALDLAIRRRCVDVRSAEVAAITSAGTGVRGVELSDGTAVAADAVIVAAGAWSGLLKGLPRRLPIRPVRGQMIQLRGLTAPLSVQVADHDGRYVLPRADASVVAGSTMEEVGFEERVTLEGQNAILASAVRALPSLGQATIVETWSGLRPLTPDGLPVLGPEPEMQGLHYAAGYGRNGILLGFHAGRLVARGVLGHTSVSDLRAFRPDRF